MAQSSRISIFNSLRRMSAEVAGASDAQLLERFATRRDEAAFELLLWRHARLVFGVCLRVLHNQHDAEDAMQATFLALARRADRIARREAVAGWLHKVAYRAALTLRCQRTRRSAHERAAAVERISVSTDSAALAETQDLRHVLDQEIGRLPARFRSAVVLCYLEGKTVDEAAALLSCPRGTVASRLARARQRLHVRLAARGLAVTAALAVLPQAEATPLSLIPTLTAAALRCNAGAAVADVLSPRITALTEEVLRAMFLHKLKTGVVILIACIGILLAGGGLALGLRANTGPKVDPPGSGQNAQGPKEQAREKPGSDGPCAVAVSHAVRRESAPSEDFSGRLEALRSVEVRPAVSGFVQKVCFEAGAQVKKGDLLFELDARAAELALVKAEAELSGAEAKKKHSDADRARAAKLLENKNISREEYEAATQQVAGANAALKAAQVDVARAKLEVDATRVTAPMSGQMSRPLVEAGSLVFRGQDRATLLGTVSSFDPIGLAFDMDETAFLRYQRLLRDKQVKGTGSLLRMQLEREKGYAHEGKLVSFGDLVDPKNGVVRVLGSFPNPGHVLLPGMFAQVRMTFGKQRSVLEVPEVAVLSDQGKHYVLVVGEGNVAQARAVTLGWADDGMRVVEKGLDTDDWVITEGAAGVHAGDKVQAEKKDSPDR